MNNFDLTSSGGDFSGLEEEKVPVLLFIQGAQYYEGVDPGNVELMTEGTMEVMGDTYRLSYEESELTGMEGTTTTFEVRGPRVTLTRAGGVNSQMVFEEGRQHTSLYETPYGELSIDVQTSRLQHSLSKQGGKMEIHYSIAVEHTAAGRNTFKIRIRPKGPGSN